VDSDTGTGLSSGTSVFPWCHSTSDVCSALPSVTDATTLANNVINPSKAELNPICHLLVLLGDLTFKGACIVSIFQYISNKMQCHTFYLYLETALYVSGGTSTHHQERIQLYLQHPVFVTPLLLSAAIVEELTRALSTQKNH
jgi:hypothetical protein